eukprot:299609-Pelagomonas_calceolata.AAC.1
MKRVKGVVFSAVQKWHQLILAPNGVKNSPSGAHSDLECKLRGRERAQAHARALALASALTFKSF